jgi:transposase InsO family protein
MPGKKNVLADALSQMPGVETRDSDDNREVTVLKPEHFRTVAAANLMSTDAFEDMIRSSRDYDLEVETALQRLKSQGPNQLPNGTLEWEEVDGLIYHHGRLYIPKGEDLRREALQRCHDAVAVGHPGQHVTLEEVKRYYWWPGVERYVKRYVSGCDACARAKPAIHPKGPLNPLDVPEGPWQVIGVDLVGTLPESYGYNMILVYVDHFTKQAHFVPCRNNITAEGVADAHVKHVFALHGLPEKIVSDRGTQFAARIMKELYNLLGIDMALSTAYHPQSNGQTERTNQELVKFLRLFCSDEQSEWAKFLPMAEFAYNSHVHSASGTSPFELLYGYKPTWSTPAGGRATFPEVQTRLDD